MELSTVLAQLLLGLASLLSLAISLATTVVIARIVFSWLRPNPSHGFLRSLVNAVYDVTDPVLSWLRSTFPFLVVGALDLTPIVAFVGLSLFRTLAVGGLTSFALTLG